MNSRQVVFIVGVLAVLGRQETAAAQGDGAGLQVLPLTLSAPVTGVLGSAAEVDRFTFSGVAGQWLYYSATAPAPSAMAVRLVSPSGNTVVERRAEESGGPYRLLETGVQTVEVLAGGESGVGGYGFRWIDLAGAGVLVPGGVVAGTLTPGQREGFHRFEGTSGQRATIEFPEMAGAGMWTLYAPSGGVLTTRALGPDPVVQTLPTDGGYVLCVSYAGDTASFHYQTRVTLVDAVAVAASGFGVDRSGVVAPGETVEYTFVGRAGLGVYFDGMDASGLGTAWVQGLAPDGTVVFEMSSEGDLGRV
jgi:hypothetical protein